MRAVGAGAIVLWSAFVLLTLLGYAMTAELNRDESMYLSAAIASQDLAPYEDFPFLQMPGYVWFAAPFLAGWEDRAILLAGRLLNVAVAAGSILLLVVLARRVGAGTGPGIVLATTLLLQPAFLEVAGQASNHLLPVLCTLAGLVFLARGRGRAWRWCFAAGMMAGCAVDFRLSWILVSGGTAVGLILWQRPGERAAPLAWGVGFFVALLPALVVALRSPEAFWFQNFGYHLANRAWAAGQDGFATGRGAIWYWLGRWGGSQVGHALLLCVIAGLGFQLRARGWRRSRAVAWGAFLLAGIATSAATSPWWHSHAVPFLFALTVATLALLAAASRPRWVHVLLAISMALALTAHLDRNLRMIGSVRDAASWVPVQFAEEATALGTVAVQAPVVTLSPLHALEAGLAIDPRSIGGPFLVRSRDFQGDGDHLAGRGGSGLLSMELDGRAWITGVETEFEEDLALRLQAAGFLPAARTRSGAILWTNQPASTDAH